MEWQRSARGDSGGMIVLQRIDPHSRRHLRAFFARVVLLVPTSSPTLLVDDHAPVLFLSLLRTTFGLTALFLAIGGLFSRQQTREAGIGLWDHCLAFVSYAGTWVTP